MGVLKVTCAAMAMTSGMWAQALLLAGAPRSAVDTRRIALFRQPSPAPRALWQNPRFRPVYSYFGYCVGYFFGYFFYPNTPGQNDHPRGFPG